jgi:hypothetical protein
MSSTTSLCLQSWRGDALSLLRVLTSAQRLLKIKIDGWTNIEGGFADVPDFDDLNNAVPDYTDLPEFLTGVADQLMPRLEALELVHMFDQKELITDEDQALVVHLVEVAATCQRLRVLELPCITLTDPLIRALAHCIRVNTQLEELKVSCRSQQSDEPTLSVHDLVSAMKSNYALKVVRFENVRNYDRPDMTDDPWDPDARHSIEMITSLNRAGRAYVLTEPMNQRLGHHVLVQVKEHLGCLFFHLLENPILAQRHKLGTTCCRDHKRKASPEQLGRTDLNYIASKVSTLH